MGRQRSGSPKRASSRDRQGLAPLGPVLSASQTRETPAEAGALIPGQGMLRLSNRPHGKETLSNTSLIESRRVR
jgi:hypothetical protein